MSGHTPGPWLPSGWEFSNGDRSKFRFVIQFEHKVSGPIEARNNANLIAAAPDLLEVLAEVLERMSWDSSCYFGADLESKIAKTLKRAKGES